MELTPTHLSNGLSECVSLGKSPGGAESFEMLYFQLEEQNPQHSVCEDSHIFGFTPLMGIYLCPGDTVSAELLAGGNSGTKKRMGNSPPLLS